MKNSQNIQTEFISSVVKTKNGLLFNPNDNHWVFEDSTGKHQFNFKRLNTSTFLIYGIKRTFIWYIENHSMKHSENMFTQFNRLIDFLYTQSKKEIVTICNIDIINYRGTLDKTREYFLGSVSGFLKKWYEMGFPGLSNDAYNYLSETTFKGNEKGRAVSTMDPRQGAFTDLELDAIQSGIINHYANGEITLENYLLVWLFMIYGSRPIQYAQLKLCDIYAPKLQDGSYQYIIKIPRAKNRKKARSEFKERIIPPSLGKTLLSYKEQVKNDFHDLLKDSEQAPLFSDIGNNDQGEFQYHQNSKQINKSLQKIIAGLHITSERTKEKLHITATRFRRTIGTRAAAEGHGELIIAEILDHTDTQNAGVYVHSIPEIIKRIDKAIALQMAPIAQAFAGLIFTDKSKAKRATDPAADIIDPNIDDACTPMGKCGSYGFCGLLSPLACYTCSSFQAWSDGPHEKLLLDLLKKRKILKETTDHRIASINDKTIFAVAKVVKECNILNSKTELEEAQ